MLKKLTKEMIEELIKEELAKAEQERLDEFKVSIGDNDYISTIRTNLGLPAGATKGNPSGVSGTAHKNIVNKIKRRSGGTTDTDLDDADITDLKAKKASADPAELKWIDWILDPNTKADATLKSDWGGIMTGGGGTWNHASAGYKDPNSLKTKAGKHSIKKIALEINKALSATAKPVLQDYLDFLKNTFGGSKNGATYKKAINNIQAAIAGSPGITDKTKEAINNLLTAINTGITIDDRDFEEFDAPITTYRGELPASKGATPSATTVSKATPQVDSATAAQFGIYANQSIQDVFKDLVEVANNIKTKTFPTGGAQDYFEFITKAGLVIKLGALGKVYNAQEAGYALERYLTVLFGGAQVGGVNGAADVVTGLQNGKLLGTSQKFVDKASEVKQAKSGMDAWFKKNKELIYTVAIKAPEKYKNSVSVAGGAGAKYEKIELFVAKITKSGNKYYTQLMDSSGTFGTAVPVKVDSDVYVFKDTGGNTLALKDKGSYIIPVIDVKTDDATAVANYARKQMTSGTSPFAKLVTNIDNVNKRLQNMRLNTTEYSAVTGGSKAGIATASEYLDSLATDYTDMKKEYRDIFTAAGDFTSASAQAKAAFTESKMKELDLMIENMVKQFIKGKLND
jgi:hypothetical protein